MLLALYPLLFPRNNAHSGGTLIEPDITHRAIRGKVIIERTPAMIAAEAHLQRLQEVDDGSSDAGRTSSEVALASLPDGDQPLRDATIRIPRHERQVAGRIPESLGASLAASDAIPFELLDQAMKRYAAQQAADEDDEMAMIAIMMAGVR
jgi:hypothetical protein